ncbi:MAG: hypothetical protein COV67_08655 [Nitrospinae bacterium CG11_big_fil_rev_8_21_14_0_20_56_8]|nr:MAG: hypothetical protein COV67_08655 [Nitrospinae bacterium CG11_big_fil_rev_8_21_14_0_20_56_8]
MDNMKIFVDTNVLLDVLLKREAHYHPSSQVWSLARNRVLEAHISAVSLPNLYYIVSRLKNTETGGKFVDAVLEDFNIVPLTAEVIHQARTLRRGDLEDHIQYFSAIHAGCEYLLTRNKKDFPKTGIQLKTPKEFLKTVWRG